MALLRRLSSSTLCTNVLSNRVSQSVFVRGASAESFKRMAIYKDDEKNAKPLDDAEYPAWVWTLLEKKPSMEELYRDAQKLYDAGGYDLIFDKMSHDDLIRLFRLSSKNRIKTNNNRRKGGTIL